MKPLTDQEIKQVTLGIMKEVKRVCSLLNLRYFLAWGTLLGAIRHKGFIPWDDDADFFMFRDEYQLLIEKFNDVASSRYRLLAPGMTKGYYYTFAKVVDTMTVACESGMHEFPGMGIWLDLFPLDFLPAAHQALVEQDELIANYLKLHFVSIFQEYRILGKLWSIWEYLVLPRQEKSKYKSLLSSAETICDDFNQKIISTSDFDMQFLRTSVTLSYKCILDAADFASVFEHPFEDSMFSIPIGYSHILQKSYGDYMIPPPKRKRKQKHYKYAKWKDR